MLTAAPASSLSARQARTSGRIPIAPAPANIRDIARQVFEEVHVAFRDRPATIEHEGEEQGAWDVERVAQVIANLLSNAFQHGSPDGAIVRRTRGDHGHVVIEVQNAGSPIPAGDLARLFLPFERGDGAAPSAERSVGLGLYISKEIVAAHNGSITVRSTAKEGTVFTVRLPRTLDTEAR